MTQATPVAAAHPPLLGMQRFRVEHQAYRRLVFELETLSRHMAGRPGPGAYRALDAAIAELHDYLGSHLDAEEALLYPMIDERLRSAGTTRALRRDHRQLRLLTDRVRRRRPGLETAGAPEVAQLCAALHCLAVLLRQHLRREDAAVGAALIVSAGRR